MTSLSESKFWVDLGERVLRQEIQALGPLFVTMSATGILLDWRAASLSALYTLVWTIVKNVSGVQASADAPQWKILIDRVGSAIAASLLASLPENFWGYDHWDRVAWSAAGSAVLALLMLYGMKPTGGSDSDPSSGGVVGNATHSNLDI